MRPKRKTIPRWVKDTVLKRQNSHCAECRTIFLADDKIEYDHRPALVLREVQGNEYWPPQNDPRHIDALHASCHLKRTVGRLPGAERTITSKGSDAHLAAKFRKLEGKNKPKRKTTIPARKNAWPKRKFGS